jgi:chromosome segregation ATPase
MKYCCEKCDFNFSKKSNYLKHINRKTPCVLEEKEQFDLNKRTCEHCEELYSTVRSMKVHMSTCKKKPPEEQIIDTQKTKFEEIISQLEEKLEKQNNELEDLKTKLLNNDGKLDKHNNELKNIKTKLSDNNISTKSAQVAVKKAVNKINKQDNKINKQDSELKDIKTKLSNNDTSTQVAVKEVSEKIDKQSDELKDLKNKISTTNKKKEKAIEKYKKKAIPKALKNKVWDKYIGIDIGQTKCLCCKITNISQLNFHCGHIISEKDGGELTMDNLKPICGSCNSSMSTMNMDEFILKYKF